MYYRSNVTYENLFFDNYTKALDYDKITDNDRQIILTFAGTPPPTPSSHPHPTS